MKIISKSTILYYPERLFTVYTRAQWLCFPVLCVTQTKAKVHKGSVRKFIALIWLWSLALQIAALLPLSTLWARVWLRQIIQTVRYIKCSVLRAGRRVVLKKIIFFLRFVCTVLIFFIHKFKHKKITNKNNVNVLWIYMYVRDTPDQPTLNSPHDDNTWLSECVDATFRIIIMICIKYWAHRAKGSRQITPHLDR